jgi:AbrB family looped-hinge helix DNA binding protein
MPLEKTKLSTKGQVILPKSIRDANRWAPGTEFSVEAANGGVFLKPVWPFPPTTLDQVAGMLKRKGQRTLTIEEMDEGMKKAIRRRHASGR